MQNRVKTPQEKKVLSYAKDRRNTYGENVKSSRTSIRQNKRLVNRANRHGLNQTLAQAANEQLLEKQEKIENAALGKRLKSWRKFPDEPLGEIVQKKVERRLSGK